MKVYVLVGPRDPIDGGGSTEIIGVYATKRLAEKERDKRLEEADRKAWDEDKDDYPITNYYVRGMA